MAPPVCKQIDIICTGCKQTIPNKEHLACLTCKESYDLECANVSDRQYQNLTKDGVLTWECPECQCKKPKTNNCNTPIRPHSLSNNNITTPETNITFRIKPSQSQYNNDTINSEDLSILGDTMETNIETRIEKELTLNNLAEMITLKLKENNKSILQEIQTMIHTEIKKATLKLREDMKQETSNLIEQNDQRKAEIEALNLQIEKLNKETNSLQNEIKKLASKSFPSESNTKKFVIYGLIENQRESEYEIHERIINVFRDTLQIDLLGYIEDTYRIGRQNHNNTRPLVVELISKRMVKYLINNNRYLYGSGLNITEFLNDEERKEMKILREKMLIARKKGFHAVIRNKKLFIEGELIHKKEDLDAYTAQSGTYENKERTYINTTKDDANATTTTTTIPQINQENHTFRKNRTTF